MPDEPEVAGLLALMLLTESRRPARDDADGELVLLADQDRSPWDRRADRRGAGAWCARCLRRNRPGPYQLQAAINAVHSDAATAADTDWGQIVALYDQLLALAPTPVVALNRAVAVAEVDGPAAGLALVDGARPRRATTFPRRAGRPAAPAGPATREAVAAYDAGDRADRQRAPSGRSCSAAAPP